MKFRLPRLRNCIIVFMALTYLAGADAVQGADWQSAGRSLAATQAGTATFYQMASDLLWRRSDDNRFTAYKDLLEPSDDTGWWVKTDYRSYTFPDYGSLSYSQDYSATLIGYESPHNMARWGGTLHQGADEHVQCLYRREKRQPALWQRVGLDERIWRRLCRGMGR